LGPEYTKNTYEYFKDSIKRVVRSTSPAEIYYDYQMEKFFEEVGYSLEKLSDRAPKDCNPTSIRRAAREVFDTLYCYELIQIPREIFKRASKYYVKTTY